MNRSPPNKYYHVHAAIQAADSFRRHAHVFISSIPRDVNQAHHHAARDFGGLIASATNLALSIELYLKALRMVVGLPIPENHHLWSLYKDLPRKLKEDFERHYNAQNPRDGSDVAALEVAVNPTGAYSEEIRQWTERTSAPDHDSGLKSILVKSSNAFRTWRYIYEVRPGKGVVLIRYEFLRLDLVAHLARGLAVTIMEARGLSGAHGPDAIKSPTKNA